MAVTRIGTDSLKSGTGSVAMPDGVVFKCQNCCSPCADHGPGVAEFAFDPADCSVTIMVDCRACGTYGKVKLAE